MATRSARVRAVAIAPKPQPNPTNILSVIARAAADPVVLPEKMRALLDMQKEIMAEEGRVAFTEDYIKMASELPVIDATGLIEIRSKDKDSGERTGRLLQATPYAKYNSIWKAVQPILQRHGFALIHSTDSSPYGRVIVRSILMHNRGYQRESVMVLPMETSGSKNNVQGVGSSVSYGKRYNAVQLLNLISEAPEDRDTDGVAVITQEQADALVDLAVEVGADQKKFCAHMQIPTIADLPSSRYEEAKAKLQLRRYHKGKAS